MLEFFIIFAVCVIILIRISLSATTIYEISDDNLVIRRLGMEWRRIHFREIDSIEVSILFVDKFRQANYFQPRFGKMTRIKEKDRNRYVLINPKNTEQLAQAVERYEKTHL